MHSGSNVAADCSLADKSDLLFVGAGVVAYLPGDRNVLRERTMQTTNARRLYKTSLESHLHDLPLP